MAEARSRAAWARTSTILALVANVNRDPRRSRAFTPADFNPFESGRGGGGVPLTPRNMDILKQVATPRKGRVT